MLLRNPVAMLAKWVAPVLKFTITTPLRTVPTATQSPCDVAQKIWLSRRKPSMWVCSGVMVPAL